METGLLNFHDEEHFPVFGEESGGLVNENSIFDSFVEVLNDDTSWIIPKCEDEFGLEPVVTETKENYQKTFQDWQQHISNLQVNDNDGKDESLLCDPLGLPDIFGNPIAIPNQSDYPEQEEVEEKKEERIEEVHTYKVAKRKGLVIKLTKRKDGCDKSNSSKSIKDDHSSLSKSKKRDSSSSVHKINSNSKNKGNSSQSIKIKSEPLEEHCEKPLQEQILVENVSSSSMKGQNEKPSNIHLPKIKIEETDYFEISQDDMIEDYPVTSATDLLQNIKMEKIDSPYQNYSSSDVLDDFQEVNSILEAESFIDVEKIDAEPVPVFEAGDLTTLLEQFESSNNVNEIPLNSDLLLTDDVTLENSLIPEKEEAPPNNVVIKKEVPSLMNEAIADKEVTTLKSEIVIKKEYPIANEINIKKERSLTSEVVIESDKLHHKADNSKKDEMSKSSYESDQTKQKPQSYTLKPCNKSILEALPKEVIDRIKESSKRNKKVIPVVPAGRLPTHGNEHLKDAGATPAKAVRLMSNQRNSGESAQLDHDYCTSQQQEGSKKSVRDEQSNQVGEWERKWDSKKDSGLESGDVSDSSETLERTRGKPSPSQPSLTSEIEVKEENAQIEPGEIVEEPKKKKLNLEEYRNRRKNVKPRSPVKYQNNNGWNIPIIKIENGENKSSQMVNAEVQVQIEDTKPSIKKENNSEKSYPNDRLRRRSTSSSSSSGSKSRYRRRGRSRRRRYGRNKRSYLSNSRSRSRSRPRSHSRSKTRSRTRTRSRSRSTSYSYTSSSSRSRSRSRGGSRRRHRSRSGYHRNSSHRYSSRHYSSRRHFRRSDDWSPVEKMRQVEERRVIYVGRLEEGTTKSQLRERFACFGPIIDISLHFREKGDNYGFVTFLYKVDAYEAVEHGNDYPHQPKYDICFGGRRAFCKQRYSDLDGTSPQQSYSPHQQSSRSCDSFDKLLREAQKKLKKSNHV